MNLHQTLFCFIRKFLPKQFHKNQPQESEAQHPNHLIGPTGNLAVFLLMALVAIPQNISTTQFVNEPGFLTLNEETKLIAKVPW
jgi:hypothetical protein